MSSEIKADKWSPASGTSATIGDSGDTFTVPSGVTLDTSSSTLSLPSSAITGQTAITSLADTDKFLVSDASDSGNLKYVENQYLGGGTLVQTAKVFYESTQSTDNITLVNAFTDDYDHYVMFCALTPSTNAVQLNMRFKNNAETQVSGSNYDYASRYFNSDGGSGSSTGSGQDKIVLTESLSNNPTDSPFVGTLWFNINRNHSSTGNMGAFNCHGQYHVVEINNNRRNRAYYHASFYRDSLTNFKAKDIKLYVTSGNFLQANVRMYGIKESNS